jgi:hypothetical protein
LLFEIQAFLLFFSKDRTADKTADVFAQKLKNASFVHEIELELSGENGSEFLTTVLPQVCSLTLLESLSVNVRELDVNISVAMADVLRLTPTLRKLGFYGYSFVEKSLDPLFRTVAEAKLDEFAFLSQKSEQDSVSAIQIFQAAKNHLFQHTTLTNIALSSIYPDQEIKNWQDWGLNLLYFRFFNDKVQADTFRSVISAVLAQKNLNQLSLNYQYLDDDCMSLLIQGIQDSTAIKELRLLGVVFSDEVMCGIEEVLKCESVLAKLEFIECSILPEGFAHLANGIAANNSLTRLSFVRTAVSKELSLLADALRSNTSIVSLKYELDGEDSEILLPGIESFKSVIAQNQSLVELLGLLEQVQIPALNRKIYLQNSRMALILRFKSYLDSVDKGIWRNIFSFAAL